MFCFFVFFYHQKKIQNVGGWRPTKHQYKYRTYLNVFFHQRKNKVGGERPTKHQCKCRTHINVIFHQRKNKVGGQRPTKHQCKYRPHINVFGGQLYHRLVKLQDITNNLDPESLVYIHSLGHDPGCGPYRFSFPIIYCANSEIHLWVNRWCSCLSTGR